MTRRLSWLVAVITMAGTVGVTACQRESSETNKKLDALLDRLDALEKRIDSRGPAVAGGRAGQPGQPGQPQQPPRQRPPEPDPKAVYSVSIAGDPIEGEPTAKITIVEAFEFA